MKPFYGAVKNGDVISRMREASDLTRSTETAFV
jgi:hypothetical protein